MQRWIFLSCVWFAYGCATTSSDESTAAESTESSNTLRRDSSAGVATKAHSETAAGEAVIVGKTIVSLRSKNATVTVTTSPVGPLFSVRDVDGKVMAAELSLVELEDRFPDVYDIYRSAVAERGILYAGLGTNVETVEASPSEPAQIVPTR